MCARRMCTADVPGYLGVGARMTGGTVTGITAAILYLGVTGNENYIAYLVEIGERHAPNCRHIINAIIWCITKRII